MSEKRRIMIPGEARKFDARKQTHEAHAQESVHDLMLEIDEIERMDLPLLEASLVEPGITSADKEARRKMIEMLKHQVGQLAELTAEMVGAVERGDISFEELRKHDQFVRAQRLLKGIKTATATGQVGEYLDKRKREVEMDKEKKENPLLPPQSMDTRWYSPEEIEIANSVLIADLSNEIALHPEYKDSAEIVMRFLADRDVIKRTYEFRETRKFEEGNPLQVDEFPFTLAWIQTHEPDVWQAMIHISQGEEGRKLLKAMMAQDDTTKSLYTEVGLKDMEALPNSLMIAVHNSSRLLQAGMKGRGKFQHEQDALTQFYGSMPEELGFDAEQFAISIQIEKVLEGINDEKKKEIIKRGFKHWHIGGGIMWEGWKDFLRTLEEGLEDIEPEELDIIRDGFSAATSATYKKELWAQRKAIERQQYFREHAKGMSTDVGRIPDMVLPTVMSAIDSPIKTWKNIVRMLRERKVDSVDERENRVLSEHIEGLKNFREMLTFLQKNFVLPDYYKRGDEEWEWNPQRPNPNMLTIDSDMSIAQHTYAYWELVKKLYKDDSERSADSGVRPLTEAEKIELGNCDYWVFDGPGQGYLDVWGHKTNAGPLLAFGEDILATQIMRSANHAVFWKTHIDFSNRKVSFSAQGAGFIRCSFSDSGGQATISLQDSYLYECGHHDPIKHRKADFSGAVEYMQWSYASGDWPPGKYQYVLDMEKTELVDEKTVVVSIRDGVTGNRVKKFKLSK